MTKQQLSKNNIENLNNLSELMCCKSNCNEGNIILSLEIELFTMKPINDFIISYVGYKDDIDAWIRIVSDSFSRYINYEVIHKISKNVNIDFILVYKNDLVIGCALLFTNSDVISIHLIGESPLYKNQGITEHVIQEVVAFAKREQIEYVTLRLDTTSVDFYKSLGFEIVN